MVLVSGLVAEKIIVLIGNMFLLLIISLELEPRTKITNNPWDSSKISRFS